MKSFITSTVIKRLDGDDNLFNKVGRWEGGRGCEPECEQQRRHQKDRHEHNIILFHYWFYLFDELFNDTIRATGKIAEICVSFTSDVAQIKIV